MAGICIDNCDLSRLRRYWRVVTTCDGGRTWRADRHGLTWVTSGS